MLPSVEKYRFITAFKGAPTSCLVAMFMVGVPVSRKWLAAVTGYPLPDVHEALSFLVYVGLLDYDMATGRYRLIGGSIQDPVGDAAVLWRRH